MNNTKGTRKNVRAVVEAFRAKVKAYGAGRNTIKICNGFHATVRGARRKELQKSFHVIK